MKHIISMTSILVATMFAGAVSQAVAATNYFSSANVCSEINETLSKLNEGDKVLFKCGDTFNCALSVTQGGSQTDGVVIGAYYDENGQMKEGITDSQPLPVIKGSISISGSSHYVTLENIAVEGNGDCTNPRDGISIDSQQCTVRGCKVSGHCQNGIVLTNNAQNCTIEKNICYENNKINTTPSPTYYSQILSLGNQNIIRFNHCYDVSNVNSCGIKVYQSPNSSEAKSFVNYKIYGNCIAVGHYGLSISLGYQGSTFSNSHIVNNTIVLVNDTLGNTQHCLYFWSETTGVIYNNTIKNNIFYNPSNSPKNSLCEIGTNTAGTLDLCQNLFFTYDTSKIGISTSSCTAQPPITTDPNLSGNDWKKLSSFALNSNSGAINAGTTTSINTTFLECDGADAPPGLWLTRSLKECGKNNLDVGADIYCPETIGKPEAPNLHLMSN